MIWNIFINICLLIWNIFCNSTLSSSPILSPRLIFFIFLPLSNSWLWNLELISCSIIVKIIYCNIICLPNHLMYHLHLPFILYCSLFLLFNVWELIVLMSWRVDCGYFINRIYIYLYLSNFKVPPNLLIHFQQPKAPP